MAVSSIRQRGITLIEILLVATIVAAGVVGVFMFTKKASVSAAVEREQAQVERLVRTIESAFALQPNFGALGTNGAAYLRDHANQAGIELATNEAGNPALATRLGGGNGTVELRAAQVDFANGVSGVPNNGFVLVYSGLSSEECIGLITATSALTTRSDVGTPSGIAGGVLVADRGKLISDRGAIASACSQSAAADSNPPVVHLSFAPSRAIASSTPPLAPPSTCAPVRETQLTGCPPGRVGSITQERHGVCSGSDNTMVYTTWENIEPMEDTCLLEGTPPADQSTTPTPDDCREIKQTRARACPAPSLGNIVEERTVDTCLGPTSAWDGIGGSCQEAPPVATCEVPDPNPREELIPCPSGQGGNILHHIYYSCPSPTAAPVESAPVVVSNNCTSSCVDAGTCCTVLRETQTVMEPCPAGTYGDSGTDQERFRGCLTADTQGPWGSWQTLTTTGSCTACPTVPPNTDFQWVNRERACPSGETGKITYQAEQVRTQSVSYACPSGTTSLPAPTHGSWSAWTDTGNTRNEVDTCTPEPISSCASEPPVYVNLGQVGHSLKRHYADPPTPVPGYFFSLPDTTPAHAPAWVKSAIGSLRSNVAGQYSPAVHGPPPFGWESSGVPGSYALSATNTGAGLGMCLDPATVGTLSYYYSYLVLPDGVGFFEGGNVLAHTWSGQTAACMSACDAEAFYDNWPPAPDCATAYSTALTYGRVTNDDDMLGNGLPTPGEPLLKVSAVAITSTGSGCSATLETTRYPTNVQWSTSFGYEGGQMIHWVKTN